MSSSICTLTLSIVASLALLSLSSSSFAAWSRLHSLSKLYFDKIQFFDTMVTTHRCLSASSKLSRFSIRVCSLFTASSVRISSGARSRKSSKE